MKTWSEGYKGYKLICTPQLLADGRFGAKLFVQKDMSAETQEFLIGVKPNIHNSEEDAANAARIAGQKWIDEQG